jgi:hypothetical protein
MDQPQALFGQDSNGSAIVQGTDSLRAFIMRGRAVSTHRIRASLVQRQVELGHASITTTARYLGLRQYPCGEREVCSRSRAR